MRDVAARLCLCLGDDVFAYTVDQSEISTKGAVVNLSEEEPWLWQRMDRAAAEAAAQPSGRQASAGVQQHYGAYASGSGKHRGHAGYAARHPHPDPGPHGLLRGTSLSGHHPLPGGYLAAAGCLVCTDVYCPTCRRSCPRRCAHRWTRCWNATSGAQRSATACCSSGAIRGSAKVT